MKPYSIAEIGEILQETIGGEADASPSDFAIFIASKGEESVILLRGHDKALTIALCVAREEDEDIDRIVEKSNLVLALKRAVAGKNQNEEE